MVPSSLVLAFLSILGIACGQTTLAHWAVEYSGNGHYYLITPAIGSINFDMVKTYAQRFVWNNTKGYPVTITSAGEDAFLRDHFCETYPTTNSIYTAGYLSTTGNWTWMAGPENGVAFFRSPNISYGLYTNWGASQPSGGSGATYMSFWQGGTPRCSWDDSGLAPLNAPVVMVEFSPYCGDGVCREYENCPADCSSCSVNSNCSANGYCGADGKCHCNYPGYVGNGVTCSDYDECLVNNGNDCVLPRSCQNAVGGYNCSNCFPPNYNDGPYACKYCLASTTCNGHGICGAQGQCVCNWEYEGEDCASCAEDFYNYPLCSYCFGESSCNGHGNCSSTGTCECDVGFDPATNCSTCAPDFYDYPYCIHCDDETCNYHGTCASNSTCACNEGFAGSKCDQCAADYYSYPLCSYCNAGTSCNGHGECNSNGECACKEGFTGSSCGECMPNFYNYPSCTYCFDSTTCHGNGTCSAFGTCECFEGFDPSSNCGSCAHGYYYYPVCSYCDATLTCSANGFCDAEGQCTCYEGFSGPYCEQCAPDFYSYPQCVFCDPVTNCSGNGNCSASGTCECAEGFAGPSCDQCAPGFYHYPDCTPCMFSFNQVQINVYNEGEQTWTEWLVTLQVGHTAVYDVSIIATFPENVIFAAWNIQEVGASNIYTLPSWRYQGGVIPANSHYVTFEYVISGAEPASFDIIGDPCNPTK